VFRAGHEADKYISMAVEQTAKSRVEVSTRLGGARAVSSMFNLYNGGLWGCSTVGFLWPGGTRAGNDRGEIGCDKREWQPGASAFGLVLAVAACRWIRATFSTARQP